MSGTIYVPLDALQELVRGARAQSDEERGLRQRIREQQQRAKLVRAKTVEMEHKLAQFKSDHRQSVLTHASPSKIQPVPQPALLEVGPSRRTSSPTHAPSIERMGSSQSSLLSADSNQLSVQSARVAIARDRVGQLEEVMNSVKEISAQGEFEDVIARTLAAAQKLVRADKYTLGLLNERRNVVELFSVGPRRKQTLSTPAPGGSEPGEHKVPMKEPRQRVFSTFGIGPSPTKNSHATYSSDGFVAADSATTYGRVIMTAKPLHIEDFYTHENYGDQNASNGVSPRALLCLPICNAHGAVVGVLQVVSMSPASLSTMSIFSDVDKKGLEFLSVVAGAAIWNLILLRERQTAQSRIEGLLKLHRNISMEAVSSAVLDQVLSVCHELIGTERIGLFMKVEGEDELYIACAADIVRGEYVPITKGIVGFVARTGETVITNDAYHHPMFDPTLDHKTGFVTRRILCLPVKSPEGAILAVLSAVNKIDNTDFSMEDAIFLNYAAEAVGISLHKASLHHKVKTSQKLIEARLKLTTFISESTDIERFVELVMEVGKEIMDCDRFGFLLIDHFKKEMWITPGVGGESIRTPMNRGISGLVATTGQVVCTRDAYKHELFDPSVDLKTGYRTTSVLCMPITEEHTSAHPKVVAVAMCINKKEGNQVVAFTQTDRDVMESFCREVQFALGRLSLDISYYKVVYDCNAVGGASDGGGLGSSAGGGAGAGGRLGAEGGYSETDIISSIVHKYCNNGVKGSGSAAAAAAAAAAVVATGGDGSGADDGGESSRPTSSAASVPALLKKKHEDEIIPFPREIAFPNGPDEPLDRWDTNTLAMSSGDIGVSCGVIFRAYGFLEAFRISGEKFAAFTTNVANYYRGNPFHNFQHAFQVLVAIHVMLRSECRKFFSGIEIFSMLVAALCHDVDHPGNTNDFELKTLSPMALTHNDDAVLERHHCRVTFIILNHKSAKILQHLDETRYKRVRQLIISCILATDMSKHFEKCKALESLTRRQLSEKRGLVMAILMHAADLSYMALPFRQSHDWGNRLLDEFQNQAKAEAEQNVVTDVFMLNLESLKHRLIVQLNMINYVARPIWLPLTSLCHHLRFYADELERNFELYQEQLYECRVTEHKAQAQARANSTIHVTVAPLPGAQVVASTSSSSPPSSSSPLS